MSTSSRCTFCELPASRIIDHNGSGVIIRDAFPVSPGHTLVIAHRHVGSFFDLTAAERHDLLVLLDHAKTQLDREFQPQGCNIGINDGPVAGQTVPHIHIHLIPRYPGDVPDPRGGVRWVVPRKADYWTPR